MGSGWQFLMALNQCYYLMVMGWVNKLFIFFQVYMFYLNEQTLKPHAEMVAFAGLDYES